MLTALVITAAVAWVAIIALAARVEHGLATANANARATLAQVEADRLERRMSVPLTPVPVRLGSAADHPANNRGRRMYRDAR